MNPVRHQPNEDISLWLSGESVSGAADRAIDSLVQDAHARRWTGAAVAIEDLVRDWYGGIPLPPPEPQALERREQRSVISAAASALVALILITVLFGGGPFERAIDMAGGLTSFGTRLPLATGSWWQLRQQGTDHSDGQAAPPKSLR
jgi:hypothetical protein